MNYTWYEGHDEYSDGDIEDKILNIVREHEPNEFPQIIAESGEWPVLYHLSEYRANVLYGIPFKKTDSVLEIGAGCGAITGYVCQNAGQVTSVDLSKRRCLINANRHKDCDNLEIVVANFRDVCENIEGKYDYVLLIGVLEYAKWLIEGDNSYARLLTEASKMLKPNGKIVIAIENRFGLKYFAGCKEDHLGTVFVGVNGYNNDTEKVQTFTKSELTQIIENAGFKKYKFYYPYPDYKFATTIYSDDCLPKPGELSDNIRNYDNSRLVLFDEGKVFDGLIGDGIFQNFSNSFLVVLNKE